MCNMKKITTLATFLLLTTSLSGEYSKERLISLPQSQKTPSCQNRFHSYNRQLEEYISNAESMLALLEGHNRNHISAYAACSNSTNDNHNCLTDYRQNTKILVQRTTKNINQLERVLKMKAAASQHLKTLGFTETTSQIVKQPPSSSCSNSSKTNDNPFL